MLSYFRWVLFFVALFVTLMGGALWLGNRILNEPGPLAATKNVVIPRGAGPQTMAKLLNEEGVLNHPRLFRVALMIDPTPRPIKAGEYEIKREASIRQVLDTLIEGRALLQKAADQNLRLYAVHFPYPGLGRVKAQGDGFVWVPEQP